MLCQTSSMALGQMHAAAAVALCAATLLATWTRVAAAAPGMYGAAFGSHAADYVIVGGGTAGCAVAARLCERLPDATVVVLERSAPRTPELEVLVQSPRETFSSWAVPGVTEAWQSEPIEALLPSGARQQVLTGNTLGGTSAVNAAQWSKPPLATVAQWGFAGAFACMRTKDVRTCTTQ